MNSSTRSITLVLVGSIIAGGAIGLLSGGGDQDGDGNQNPNGVRHRGGIIPIFIGGGGRSGPGVSAPVSAPSARGGFGGTGGGFGTTSGS